jgi:glycosyltransferase involved in cell wall biosynthesis
VPVIASDQRSNPELIEPGINGELVPVGNTDATIKALDGLLSDRPRLLEMGVRAAADLSQRLNWDRYVPEILRVYRGVTGDVADTPDQASIASR